MILTRFFKPKWQHPNPEVRKQALRELSPSDPVVLQAARQDRSPEVRRAVLERITELAAVRQIADQDADSRVREAAAARYRELLSGSALGSPPVSARIAALPTLDSALVEFLTRHAKEPELRLAALARVERQALLGEAALNDTAAQVRFAALERLTDAGWLEQVARQSRNRDKRVYRTAQERLDQLRAGQARAARLEQLCSELENLAWDGESGASAGRFPKLEKEWKQWEAEAEPGLRERYGQARARFLALRQESAARRTARQDICADLERCLEQLAGDQALTPEGEAALRERLQSAQRNWVESGAVEDSEGRRLEGHFMQLVHAIEERERMLHRNRERVERLRAVLHQAETLLNQASEVLEPDIAALRQRWTGLERPESKTLAADLHSQFEGILSRLRARLQRQVEHRDQELKEIQALIDNLEAALEAGELQQAIDLHEQARQRLRHNIGLSRKQMAGLEERLHACLPTLNALRGWRRWGTHQAREHLCQEAERLVGSALDPLGLAQQVKALRNAWRALDGTEGAASKALWKRFDTACEQAYGPCQAYFEAQTRQRQRNLAKKQALCERLENMEHSTSWEQQVDWGWVDRAYREAQREWRKIGPVNRVDKRALDKRYNAALKRLDSHLTQERERDLQRRQELIQQVQTLAREADLHTAVEGAKRAQADWQPTVQASRREEQALWHQFRAACDAVFERRQAEQQAAEDERQANLARKTALCEALEALADVDEAGIHPARRRLQEAREEWQSIGPVPKTAYRGIQQRFDQACQQVERREQVLQEEKARRELHSLHARGRLCDRLEALLEEESPATARTAVAQAQREWRALAPVKAALAGPLERRFEAVCRALTEDAEAGRTLCRTLSENLPRKQELCLRMEIMAGLESPAELAKARMELQVARLSESLINRDVRSQESALEEAREIEEEWGLLGALPAAQSAALTARFERAVAALGH